MFFEGVVRTPPSAEGKNIVIQATLFADEAVLASVSFERPAKDVSPAARPRWTLKPLRRQNRVFISYKSEDIERVALAINAYEVAGLKCFWDKRSLSSGHPKWEQWLFWQIDRSDVFHLFWSESAAANPSWIEKEALHAYRASKGGRRAPQITITMLDGPPWPPHPGSLDMLNFNDFNRAAASAYADAVADSANSDRRNDWYNRRTTRLKEI